VVGGRIRRICVSINDRGDKGRCICVLLGIACSESPYIYNTLTCSDAAAAAGEGRRIERRWQGQGGREGGRGRVPVCCYMCQALLVYDCCVINVCVENLPIK
jgi:hypothetical protein